MGMSEMLQSRVLWVQQFPCTTHLQVVLCVDVDINREVATECPKVRIGLRASQTEISRTEISHGCEWELIHTTSVKVWEKEKAMSAMLACNSMTSGCGQPRNLDNRATRSQ